jgi:N4-gp56 family major capsid protein
MYLILLIILAASMLLLTKTNIGKRALTLTMAMMLQANPNTNVTTQTGAGQDLSPEMKTYYNKNLIRYAKPLLVHGQFGQKKPIPKRGGKVQEWRRRDPLPKALVPLTEGVTPDGRKIEVKAINATVHQFGDYITTSDVLELTAIDPIINDNLRDLGDQAGRTLDTVVRDIINTGTNVQYGDGSKLARHLLVGGESTGNDYITVKMIKNAVKTLKRYLAKKRGDSYVAIIHPDVSYHLTEDNKWQSVTNYNPKNWYNGEIGKIEGVRFVESTEAKIFHAEDLTAEARELTVASYTAGTKTVAIDEALTAADATALAGRKVIIDGVLYTIESATAGNAGAASFVVEAAPAENAPTDGDVVYPGEAGAKGRDVYSTLIIGEDAYGVTTIEGGGLENIVKAKGSAGTADPLNQRSTQGWKAIQGAVILTDAYMVRLETTTEENDYGAGKN